LWSWNTMILEHEMSTFKILIGIWKVLKYFDHKIILYFKWNMKNIKSNHEIN
jgi:hypothetical protein